MRKKYPLVHLAIICLVLLLASPCSGYTIKGTLRNVKACYYPEVYLGYIDQIDGFYHGSSGNVIASAPIDSDGHFELRGDELPNDRRLYRLYVTSAQSVKAEIRAGPMRNYIFLILNNKSDLTISCNDFCVPFFTYTVAENTTANTDMAAVQNMVNEYHVAYSQANSDTRNRFIETKFATAMKAYADTSANTLAAMWAMEELGVKDLLEHDPAFVSRFTQKLKPGLYTQQFLDQVDLLKFKDTLKSFYWCKIALAAACCLLAISLSVNIYLASRRKRRQPAALEEREAVPDASPSESHVPAEEKVTIAERPEPNGGLTMGVFTIREREILQMVDKGLSNKEIAANLNVEVSTIKTHVSRIYQKAGIKSRKEVAEILRQLDENGK